MKKSREIAFCGLSGGLGTVLLLLGGTVPGLSYSALILGLTPLLPVLEEFGWRSALGVYGVTAALALLLTPDRELALLYLLLGYYPVLRPLLNRISFLPARWACKLAVFNGAVAALYALALWVLGLPTAWPLFLVLLAGGNLVFCLVDRLLGRWTLLWRRRLRQRFFK